MCCDSINGVFIVDGEDMLVQFNFKNFKSFRDETSLDLSATKITEHEDHVINIANDKLLKVAAIYGANASGKSNVYAAFEFMTDYVLKSFNFGEEDREQRKIGVEKPEIAPFLLDNVSCNEETTFEVFYVDHQEGTGKTYQYGFSLKGGEVEEEWLFSKAKTSKTYRTIFYRKKGQELELPGITRTQRSNIELALNAEVLIVSLGAKLRIDPLKKVRDWFLNNETINFGNPIENLFISSILPREFVNSKAVQKNVVDYFSTFDTSIQDFEVEEVVVKDEENENKVFRIHALHKKEGSEEMSSIPIERESSGTQKMFALYPFLKEVLDHGSTLFIDELNARLHPLLVRNIILTFLSPEINTRNAQIIFTTHDIAQLSNGLLRRDEIWMVDKNSEGVSELYSLAEFRDEEGNKVRRYEDLAKKYLTGNYGAIPALKPMKMLTSGGKDGK